MLELETTLTDAAIALFERLTGRLFLDRPKRTIQNCLRELVKNQTA